MKHITAGIILAAVCGCLWGAESDPLEVTPGLHTMVDAYLTHIAQGFWQQRAITIARIQTPGEVREHQDWARREFIKLLGGFPPRTDLHPRVTGTLKRDGYHIDKLIFESQPHFYVTANVYVPDSVRGPYPAVLGTAGHSEPGKATYIYQTGFVSLVRRGFLVLAFDPPDQGERKEYYDLELRGSRVGIATAGHTTVGLQCLLTGDTMARYILWDEIRAMDYLVSRLDVDPKRIAVVGNSGGGMQSAYLALVEPRLAVSAPSCWMNTSETIWSEPGPQDAEQNVPGFIRAGLDVPDFAEGFAPRPFIFLTATRDFFPIAGARRAHAEAKRFYDLLGASDQIAFFEYDDEHMWSKPRREATYGWLDKWIGSGTHDSKEMPVEIERERDLWTTSTGQVASSLHGETVHSLNWAIAKKEARERPVLSSQALRHAIVRKLGMQPYVAGAEPAFTKAGEVQRSGYRVEKIVIQTEPGIQVPALVFAPDSPGKRLPAVLYVNDEGKAHDAGAGGDIEALVHSGHIVLSPDLRGWGESRNNTGWGLHNGAYQTATRALLIGRTMAGMQVFDLLRSLDYLVSRADVDPKKITSMGKGNGGVVVLFAAALDARITRIACEAALPSYMDLAESRFHRGLVDVVVPGVLKEFDLPDVAALIAPRPLWLIAPRHPSDPETSADLDHVREEYAGAARAFLNANAETNLRISDRQEGWSFDRVYKDWLAD
jgi:cephalosporin-C deacetylase-like acetyl esterase